MKGPYIKSNNKTSHMMKSLLIALFPIILFSFYKNGIVPYFNHATNLYGLFHPLLFIFVGSFSSVLIEIIYNKWILKKENIMESIKQSYALFPGLFLSLVLPINTPFIILIIGVFIAVIIGKMIYGGFGNNIFNPALIGLLFVVTMYGSYISSLGGYFNSYEQMIVSSATPLTNQNLVDGIGTYETLVKPFGTLFDFFIGNIPGSLGETSALLCLLAMIYLMIKKVIKYPIPIFYIGTVFIMTFIIGIINGLGIWYPLFQIFSGGLFFGAIFMATDPVTSATTPFGQIIEGILLGILTVILRYLTSAPEGVMTSILTLNMLVFIIDKIGLRNKNYRKKVVTISVLLTVILVSLSIYIAKSYQTKQIDNSFNVVDIVEQQDSKIYKVTQKGNGGLITIQITMKNGNVTNYEVLNHNETKTYYSKVEQENYIHQLITSKDLKNLDTVSGATISSTALKKALLNVIELDGAHE